MTKKDFELVAQILANLREMRIIENSQWAYVVSIFAENFSDTYPKFNTQRFLWAAYQPTINQQNKGGK